MTFLYFFFSSRRRHTRYIGDWSSDVCSSDLKVNPDNCVLVGVRDIDSIEKENIRRAGVEVFTMRDIDERGMRAVRSEERRVGKECRARWARDGCEKKM